MNGFHNKEPVRYRGKVLVYYPGKELVHCHGKDSRRQGVELALLELPVLELPGLGKGHSLAAAPAH